MKKSFSDIDQPLLDDSQKSELAKKWENVQQRCVENNNCKGKFQFHFYVKPLAFNNDSNAPVKLFCPNLSSGQHRYQRKYVCD